MIDFWLAAGLLLLVAMAFVLVPLLGHRGAVEEQDRTALNVALYKERLGELQAQQGQGSLSQAQFDAARTEAARELLADTEGTAPLTQGRLSRGWLWGIVFVVPLVASALYLHLGASDKVALSREFEKPPQSMEEMTTRLERAVEAQPDSAEGVYFLGRTYMAQNRPADAAKLFERAAALTGREPQVLGQWAQALYFAADKHWSPAIQALTDEALKADPNEGTSLGLLGIAAFEGQRYAEAVGYWQRLQAQLPQSDPSREALQSGIDRARERMGDAPAAPTTSKAAAALKVRVEVAPALAARLLPGDSVFVFARAVSGPPIPLAVKRLTVADLPASVELSDADAMQPALKLSAFPEVQLVARVSRSGQPTQGEFMGSAGPMASDSGASHTLTIDRPDQ